MSVSDKRLKLCAYDKFTETCPFCQRANEWTTDQEKWVNKSVHGANVYVCVSVKYSLSRFHYEFNEPWALLQLGHTQALGT